MKKPQSLVGWDYRDTIDDLIKVGRYNKGFFADWQYLIVLDACRWDTLAEISWRRYGRMPLKADTECHLTPWWYRRYWSHIDTDAHLISANPVPFFPHDGWNADKRFKTAIWADPAGSDVKARPELTAIWEDVQSNGGSIFEPELALRIFEETKIPGERYLIHLVPPHLPFLGQQGRALFGHLGLSIHGDRFIYKDIQDYGRAGHWDELRECYEENIEYALDALERFGHLFADGKAIITADHAELVGEPSFDENGIYRHARYKDVPDLFLVLRTVPWVEWEGK